LVEIAFDEIFQLGFVLDQIIPVFLKVVWPSARKRRDKRV